MKFSDGGVTAFLFLISLIGIWILHGYKNAILFIPIWLLIAGVKN